MDEHMYRKNIEVGMKVEIVLKKGSKDRGFDNRYSEKDTDEKKIYIQGGIKVMLSDGKVGRVKHLFNRDCTIE